MRKREVEVGAVMRWILDNPFVLSLSFHDGRVLVNYPWDDSPQAVEGEKVSATFVQYIFCLRGQFPSLYPQLYSVHYITMILQRIKIVVGDAGFDPGTSAPEVWWAWTNGPMRNANYDYFCNVIQKDEQIFFFLIKKINFYSSNLCIKHRLFE